LELPPGRLLPPDRLPPLDCGGRLPYELLLFWPEDWLSPLGREGLLGREADVGADWLGFCVEPGRVCSGCVGRVGEAGCAGRVGAAGCGLGAGLLDSVFFTLSLGI
jgi:hypothetical protein